MNRRQLINEIAEYLDDAPEAVRGMLIEEILKRLPDAMLLDIFDGIENTVTESGHTEPEETCDGCKPEVPS